LYPEGGGSKVLRNVGILPKHYTSYLRRPQMNLAGAVQVRQYRIWAFNPGACFPKINKKLFYYTNFHSSSSHLPFLTDFCPKNSSFTSSTRVRGWTLEQVRCRSKCGSTARSFTMPELCTSRERERTCVCVCVWRRNAGSTKTMAFAFT